MKRDECEAWLGGILPGRLEVYHADGFHVGVTSTKTQDIAATVDFNRVDTGLVGKKGIAVRAELLTVTDAGVAAAADAVAKAAAALKRAGGQLPARPGTILIDLADTFEPPEGVDAGAITARHGLLVPPFMWNGSVPQYREEPGEVTGVDETDTGDNGRLTAMLQLLMVTDSEREFFVDHGAEEFSRAMAAEHTQLLDWFR
ncbi:hypothetical protein [Corynebacterium otitidis]|uniref:hypothetical protein n=1 Tax=Corynebacterium otitidis TaxID=29321 RepID=UPI0006275BCA|nr:hypothetical protein [Corynebacterium otitidis]KKO83641.1 hypothetical protein AAV33_05310 [Corynebacterium otitidis]